MGAVLNMAGLEKIEERFHGNSDRPCFRLLVVYHVQAYRLLMDPVFLYSEYVKRREGRFEIYLDVHEDQASTCSVCGE